MVGNVESDYRIDGWSNGEWLEGDDNTTLTIDLAISQPATLTLNLEDGSVSSSFRAEARLGSICQGEDGVGLPCSSKDKKENITPFKKSQEEACSQPT